MNRRTIVTIAVLLAAAIWPLCAMAQRVEHGRGNIVSIDQNRLTVDLRDPQNRTATWRFRRDATVKFTDGAPFFPNPSVQDLRPPMYVHYTFVNEVIDSFDVVELGFNPGNPADTGSSSRKEQGVSRTVTGRVTAYDPSVRQVEIEHDGTRETFQLTNRSDQRLQAGQRVELRTDWSGQQELVSQLRVVGGRNDNSSRRTGGGSSGAVNRGSRGGSRGNQASSAEGEVVRITSRGVVMLVGGAEQTYAVADSGLLRRLRVGDTVTFDWEDRNGGMVITNVR